MAITLFNGDLEHSKQFSSPVSLAVKAAHLYHSLFLAVSYNSSF